MNKLRWGAKCQHFKTRLTCERSRQCGDAIANSIFQSFDVVTRASCGFRIWPTWRCPTTAILKYSFRISEFIRSHSSAKYSRPIIEIVNGWKFECSQWHRQWKSSHIGFSSQHLFLPRRKKKTPCVISTSLLPSEWYQNIISDDDEELHHIPVTDPFRGVNEKKTEFLYYSIVYSIVIVYKYIYSMSSFRQNNDLYSHDSNTNFSHSMSGTSSVFNLNHSQQPSDINRMNRKRHTRNNIKSFFQLILSEAKNLFDGANENTLMNEQTIKELRKSLEEERKSCTRLQPEIKSLSKQIKHCKKKSGMYNTMLQYWELRVSLCSHRLSAWDRMN